MANDNDGRYVQAQIPRFDGHYDHWSMLMENFMRSKEYWGLIDTGIGEPKAGTTLNEAHQKRLDENRLKDMKAKNYLFQAIDRAILETISDKKTSKSIWDSMAKKYQGGTRVKKSILQAQRKEFENLEMKSGENVTEYISRVMTIANKMRIHGESMQHGVIVEKILRSLTEKYTYITCAIEESRDTEKMTIDEVQASLVVHEQKMNKGQNRGEEQTLKAASQDTGGRGRGSTRGRGRGRGRQPREVIECYKCRKLGHYRNECPEWEKETSEITLSQMMRNLCC